MRAESVLGWEVEGTETVNTERNGKHEGQGPGQAGQSTDRHRHTRIHGIRTIADPVGNGVHRD